MGNVAAVHVWAMEGSPTDGGTVASPSKTRPTSFGCEAREVGEDRHRGGGALGRLHPSGRGGASPGEFGARSLGTRTTEQSLATAEQWCLRTNRMCSFRKLRLCRCWGSQHEYGSAVPQSLCLRNWGEVRSPRPSRSVHTCRPRAIVAMSACGSRIQSKHELTDRPPHGAVSLRKHVGRCEAPDRLADNW